MSADPVEPAGAGAPVGRPEHVDVLLIGAGLSGIGAAAQLTRSLPGRRYAVLEARDASGGTWDLFRYPGVRSDSDMFTLGYRFKPWRGEKALADGPSILEYVRETAREYDVERHVRYRHRVTSADWEPTQSRWVVRAETPDGEVVLTADFLWSTAGYYAYDAGYTPELPGIADYRGRVVHPQHWPEKLDHTGRRVLVIGSGATAVTLVPALADRAARVTMLQRSPTYVLSMPAVDRTAVALRRWLPERGSYLLTRWKNVVMTSAIYRLSRARPRLVRRLIRRANVALLPEGYDVDTHFRPRYDPWDQRLCLVPDADLFRAIGDGRVEMVTDRIERFTPTGVRLESGREIDADVVVTATGLRLQLFGGATLSVAGEPVDPPSTMAYKAMMLSGVPNFAFTIGYTNASWTLKADLVAEYVVRLLRHLDRTGRSVAVPEPDPTVHEEPLLDFQAGYVLRALDDLPKAGHRAPWRLRQSYLRDVLTIRRSRIDDGTLRFR